MSMTKKRVRAAYAVGAAISRKGDIVPYVHVKKVESPKGVNFPKKRYAFFADLDRLD